MSEVIPNPVDALQPGDVIQFADLTELVAFEDSIVQKIDPNYSAELWDARPHIRNLIRPPKYNGNIADISLVMLDEPYQQLLSAGSRGYKNGRSHSINRRLTEKNEIEYAPQYMGFQLLASAKSISQSTIGQIQTELYYFPFVSIVVKAGTMQTSERTLKSGVKKEYHYITGKDYLSKSGKITSEGVAIGRVILRPNIETSKFIEYDENARRIGFEVLRDCLMHPYGGMHD